MFSVENKIPLNEKSQYEPRSPYSMAKYQVFKSVNNLKQKYDWNIKNGIMFNHESEFRDEEYLFSKIIDAAIAIKNKKQSVLKVGSLTYVRDWSFAGDIAEAVASVNSYDDISDFVIGSGTGTSIQKLVEITFSELGLDYEDFIEVDSNLLRVGDPEIVISDPSKLKSKLGWYPKVNVEKLIQRCINFRTN
jgi:GDPmannose 4,6-dehydratase